MPVFEYLCSSCARVNERYVRRWDDPEPHCPACGGQTEKMASRFAAPFMGSIRKYTDLRRENAQMDGYWAYRKHSSISGQMEPVWLDSMTAVRDFNKAEGLSAPGDVPTNSTISADGRTILSDGMPGCWRGAGMPSIPARLQEIIDLPDEAFKQAPATATPCMPVDYGIRAEAVENVAEFMKDA